MTVAVANSRVMLADTRIVTGNAHYECQKISEVRYKGARYLIVGAGDARDHERYVAHFKRRGFAIPEESFGEDFEALLLGPNGLFHVESGGWAGKVGRQWFAIGSGGDVAIGSIATQLGGEAREPTVAEMRTAIEIALRFADCGGSITQVELR